LIFRTKASIRLTAAEFNGLEFREPSALPLRKDDSVNFNLAAELGKGGHYYNIPHIRQELKQAPMPLLNSMKRFFLDEFKPIPDREPDVTKHLRAVIQDATSGTMRSVDYSPELWSRLSDAQKDIQADMKKQGELLSLTLVGRQTEGGQRSYRYILEFKNSKALQRFVLDEHNKIALIQPEGGEQKPDAPAEAPRF